MPYLYRHIRLDTNEPFYIGISKCLKNYKRAYSLKRGIEWHEVTATTKYTVEIVLEHDCLEFIKQREIEFIALYGRKDLGLGTLVNLTNGGDGFNTLSETAFKKKRRPRPESSGAKNISSQEVVNTETLEEHGCAKDVAKLYFYSYASLIQKLNFKQYNDTPFIYKRDYIKGYEINQFCTKPKKDTEIIDVETKQIFTSVAHASRELGINVSTLEGYVSRRSLNKTNLMLLSEYKEGMSLNKAIPFKKDGSHTPLIDVFTNKIYTSQMEAGEALGYGRGHIYGMLSGWKSNYTGLMYYEEYLSLKENDEEELNKIIEGRRKIVDDYNNRTVLRSVSLLNYSEDELKHEEWRDIKNFEGLFQISNLGRIKGLERTIVDKNGQSRKVKETIIKGRIDTTKEDWVLPLKNEKETKTFYLPRLVIETFIGVSQDSVVFLDGDKYNIRLSNLRYANSPDATFENIISSKVFECGVVDVSTGRIYNSRKEAAKELGVNYGTLKQRLNGLMENTTTLLPFTLLKWLYEAQR